MTMRRGASHAVCWVMAVVVAGCGAPDHSEDAPLAAAEASTSDATPAAAAAAATTAAIASARTVGEERWLFPQEGLTGLRLVESRRSDAPDCGLTSDCAATMPTATLSYDTDERGVTRTLRIEQFVPAEPRVDAHDGMDERAIGDRRIQVIEQGDGATSSLRAIWIEPEGIVVDLQASGLDWEQVAVIIRGLRPVDPAAWPTVAQPPPGSCLDPASQLAPTAIPDGWQRFVLQARATGSCDPSPFLTMSLVQPGTADGPGILVTVVIGGSAPATPTGEVVLINDSTGRLSQSVMADGTSTASISITIDGVSVDAHGNAEPAQLTDIVAGIRPLDEAAWTELVGSVVT